jgi:hypothetical protein
MIDNPRPFGQTQGWFKSVVPSFFVNRQF